MTKRAFRLPTSLTFLQRGPRISNGWIEESLRERKWEHIYRGRWQHDKVVRSTHGVNCTGSCSWKVHVKDGIITWETQHTDYPSLGPEMPEYEPRGCPRGASFSWYEYSPLRVRYPYVRGALLGLWRKIRAAAPDPVTAWTQLVSDPANVKAYQTMRGKGGFIRAPWDEVAELIAAATIYTIKTYGPDRVVGFTPIPAMSMVSYAAGTRFLSLIGGTILSFYDWYADLPIASPQVWGEQTDVPESADWYNAAYLIIWGTNLPMTRTPDAHFMVEVRYRGTKVAAVAPDYAEYVKFADTWLPARAGTDGALAMAMSHVVLKEFYVDKPTPYFLAYAKKYTDLPYLVRLMPKGDGYLTGGFISLADLGGPAPTGAPGGSASGATAAADPWKFVVWDAARGGPACPNGSLGHRWDGSGKWNLRPQGPDGQPIDPLLTFLGQHDTTLPVDFPYFGGAKGDVIRRHVPVRQLMVNGEQVPVTTVYDLLLAQNGIGRGLPGSYPTDYDDPAPYTPAWQEAITGVDRKVAIAVAREFADTAARTKGRSMIAMGGGINQWYHAECAYRAILNLVLLCGTEGVNGGGWAHYVGQEKVRPAEGFGVVAFAADWVEATRLQNGTSFFYFYSDQFRYDTREHVDVLTWPGGGRYTGMHPADMNALAVRLGWLPFYPQFRENSLAVVKKARAAGALTDEAVAKHVAARLAQGDLDFAVEHPADPATFPRLFFNWRSNLMGASAKGHEYFLRHLLGADGHVLQDPDDGWKPESFDAGALPPGGKLDLLVNIDFRMTGTGLYSDIVLPAATWYEKYDLSSTDMHPYVHPFNPAISTPWETRSDWDVFCKIAEVFSRLAETHLPVAEDLLAKPLLHDTPDELAQPGGHVLDWREGQTEPVPGRTMPRLMVVQRDFPHVFDQMIALGPRAAEQIVAKGIAVPSGDAYKEMINVLGPCEKEGPGAGRPCLKTGKKVVNAILGLSGPTNGRRAVESWKALEKVTGLELAHLVEGRGDEVMTHFDLTAQPRLTIAAPIWSGLEEHGRRYSPFTSNVELDIPFRTLTGRQHFYLDHEVILDFGEALPIYRPPLVRGPFLDGSGMAGPNGSSSAGPGPAGPDGPQVTLRYITPHQKWAIHTTFADTLTMLTMFRGGQTIWISDKDAAKINIKDNDWIEAVNRNGAVACRAVVSHRVPEGLCIMYHAQDRTVGVPATRATGDRGGAHNSLTRLIPKATHMIGGYGHLSYNFNYYGPTGHQRDEFIIIRPLGEVKWLEN